MARRKATEFDRNKAYRARVIGWAKEGSKTYPDAKGKVFTVENSGGKPVTSRDIQDSDGNIDPRAAEHYGVEPLGDLTISDLGEPYTKGTPDEMLAAYAADRDMSRDDMLCMLVVNSALQDAYAESLAAFRPKSDEAIKRAVDTVFSSVSDMSPEDIARLRARLAELGG